MATEFDRHTTRYELEVEAQNREALGAFEFYIQQKWTIDPET